MLTQYIEEAKKRFELLHKDGNCCGCGEGDLADLFPEMQNKLKSFLESELTALHDKVREEIAMEVQLNCAKMLLENSTGQGELKHFNWNDFAVDLSASIARGKK